MNFERYIRHAIHVVGQHRALWVLGFIWALVGGAGSGSSGQGMQYTFSGSDFNDGSGFGANPPFDLDPAPVLSVMLPLMLAACCLMVLLIVVTTVVRYVVMVGVLRSLDHNDRFGIEPTVRGAWSEGWNVRTWRPFLQNLIVGIPLAIVSIMLLVPVVSPLLLGLVGDGDPIVFGAVLSCCLFCCWLLVIIAVSTVVSVLQQLWSRAAVLDDIDFIAAMVVGWRLARANARHLVMAWVVMFVVGIVWLVLTMIMAMVLGLITAAAAGLPAFLLYQATESVVLPLIVGVPIAIVTFMLPMMFAQGLYLVFHASVWNQIYRELPERDTVGFVGSDA